MITLHEHNSIEESIEFITAALGKQIKQSDEKFSLAVAGGNTPKPLYQTLSNLDWPWENVQVTLTDERWVDEDHAQSNGAMIKSTLLTNKASSAYFLPLKNAQATALEGQQSCETNLVTQMPSLNAVILGMGSDGHFASIFPKMKNLNDALNIETSALCLAATPPELEEGVVNERMTLTLPYLVSATQIYLLCTGEDKKTIIDKVMKKKGQKYPLQFLFNKCEGNLTDTQLHICWSAE